MVSDGRSGRCQLGRGFGKNAGRLLAVFPRDIGVSHHAHFSRVNPVREHALGFQLAAEVGRRHASISDVEDDNIRRDARRVNFDIGQVGQLLG